MKTLALVTHTRMAMVDAEALHATVVGHLKTLNQKTKMRN